MQGSGTRLSSLVLRWGAPSIALACGAAMIFVIMTASLDRGQPTWARWLIALTGLSLMCATFVGSLSRQDRRRGLKSLVHQPPTVKAILAMYAGIGLMAGVVTFFAPQGSTEKVAGGTEASAKRAADNSETLIKTLRAQGDAARAADAAIGGKVSGVWGEPGCALTFRIAIDGDALQMESVKRPSGTPEWQSAATIIARSAHGIETRVEEPLEDRGQSTSLRYEKVGGGERLLWHARQSPLPIEMVRCG